MENDLDKLQRMMDAYLDARNELGRPVLQKALALAVQDLIDEVRELRASGLESHDPQ